MVMSNYMAVIGSEDSTDVMYNGVRLEVLSMLRFVSCSFGLRQHVSWQVALAGQPPTLIPFFLYNQSFSHYDSVTI